MKSLFPLFLLFIVMTACQSDNSATDINALSLDEKKTLLREKQAAMKSLNDEIVELQTQIGEEDPTAQKRGALVTVGAVEKKDFSSFVVLQGNVVAEDMLNATAEMAGRVLQLTVKEGDAVRKGQLIASIDAEAYQKQRAELETALDLANTVYERQKGLWDQNIGSEIQFLQAKNNKERVEKSLASLDVQLAKNKVYAPGSGIVERVNVHAGELAAPGVPLVQILNTNELKVAADVPENYIRSVKLGERVNISIPALALDHTVPVSLIGKTVDPANRTFKVEVKLPNNAQLKPNLLAEMKINDFTVKDAVVIPLARIQQEVSGKRYVYITEQTDKGIVARKAYVQIGKSYDNEVIITEGLKGGEQLILEGSRGLTEGQLIEITTENSNK